MVSFMNISLKLKETYLKENIYMYQIVFLVTTSITNLYILILYEVFMNWTIMDIIELHF